MNESPRAGDQITIVKHAPDGREPVRYEGCVIASDPDWIVARCDWVHGYVDIGCLEFRPGDVLDEYFALTEPFNAFAIFRPSGALAGWYCNVTHPTIVDGNTIHWHDLYIDVVITEQGEVVVLDEDELAESGLVESDPALHQAILKARDRLLELIRSNAYPFSEHSQ